MSPPPPTPKTLLIQLEKASDGEQRDQRLLGDLLDPLEPCGLLVGRLGGRRVRQREAVHGHDQSERGGDHEADTAALVEHLGRVVVHAEQDLAESDAGDDPADGAPESDGTEVAVAVGKIGEGDRVGERHGGRVDQAVDERERQEDLVLVGAGEEVDEHRADEVADGEQLLGGERPIGQLARDEGPGERANGTRHQAHAGLVEGEAAMSHEERVQDGEPGAPDRVLQEHHDREAGSDVRRGRGLHR
jgi:hypothetical protein